MISNINKSGQYIGVILGCFVLFIVEAVAVTFLSIESQKDDVLALNLGGRQWMLTQKISKEALEIQKGVEIERSRNQLKKTIPLLKDMDKVEGIYEENSAGNEARSNWTFPRRYCVFDPSQIDFDEQVSCPAYQEDKGARHLKRGIGSTTANTYQ